MFKDILKINRRNRKRIFKFETKVGKSMKQLLHQYSRYNLWANKIIIDQLAGLTEEQLHKEIASSFPSVFKTILHLMDVESVWWQRIKLAEHVEWPGKTFTGSFAELSKNYCNHLSNGKSG